MRTVEKDVRVYLAIAFGLPWLMWVAEQLTGVRFMFVGVMLAVALATFVAARWVWRPPSVLRATSVVPVGSPWWLLAAFLIFVVGSGLSVLINALTGVMPAAWDRFTLAALGPQLVQFVLILPLAFCEEWGWRGYLLNRLAPRFGVWPALVGIGLLCGLWHLPFYLDPWFSMSAAARESFPPFVLFCVFFGVLLGLLRLLSGSIWPAVVGHAVNNTLVVGWIQEVVRDGEINPWTTGLSGWQGLLLMGVVIAVLGVIGHRRGALTTDRLPVPAAAA